MSRYQPVKDIESLEKDEEYHDSSSGRPSNSALLSSEGSIPCLCSCHKKESSKWARIRKSSHNVIRIANILLFISSITILFYSYQHVQRLERNEKNSLLKITSTYSPLLDKIPLTLKTTTTNGSFWPQNPPSIYQQQPSPEVDAAWMRLADTHGIAVTASEIEKMGRNPAEQYPYPQSYTVPGHAPEEKTYLGFINVLHQIHCLNSFRKMAWPAYYGNFWEEQEQNQHGFPWNEHLAHCQYNLLQTIMCHSDLDVITFNKVKGTPGPFPDFGTQRKCRDFDSVLRWKEENQVNVDLESEWAKMFDTPEGIIELEPEGRSIPPL